MDSAPVPCCQYCLLKSQQHQTSNMASRSRCRGGVVLSKKSQILSHMFDRKHRRMHIVAIPIFIRDIQI